MNRGNFWELLTLPNPQINERAIEILRRCSTPDIFKSIVGRLSLILGYSHKYTKEELVLLGTFILEPEFLICMDQTCRLVRFDIHVHDAKAGHELIQSHFYLLVNTSGLIIDVRNKL